jgi:hypothetical protein
MVTHSLRYGYLFFFLLIGYSAYVFSDAYKWKDKDDVTHYSETAPLNQDYQVIPSPPPPLVDPNIAQKKVETLIKQLDEKFEENEKLRVEAKEKKELEQKNKEYCKTLKHNLTQYQNNPGRNMIDENGNVIPPNEEKRLEKISVLQQKINDDCHST